MATKTKSVKTKAVRTKAGKTKTAKTEKKIKKGYVKCPDCGGQYEAGALHYMFCPARTCSECGTTFGYVLPIWDSRVTPPERRCDDCTQEALDADEVEEDEAEDA